MKKSKPIKLVSNKLRTNKLSVSSIVILVILCIYTLALVALIGWAFMVAFQTTDRDVFDAANGTYYQMPAHFELHFAEVFEKLRLPGLEDEAEQYFIDILGNSLIYSILSAFLKTLVPTITAYACARYEFKTSKVVYTAILVAMIVPIVGSMPSELNLANSFRIGEYSLIIDNVIGTSLLKASMTGLYFFVMYSAFESMPNGYFEAAKIDGANNFQIFARIGLPLIATTFGTVFLINFVEYWNDYQTPLIYLMDHPTMGLSLYTLYSGGSLIAKNPQFTISFAIILVVPTLILFLFTHKKLMSNITVGGLKG